MDCTAWTAWTALHGLHCMDCMDCMDCTAWTAWTALHGLHGLHCTCWMCFAIRKYTEILLTARLRIIPYVQQERLKRAKGSNVMQLKQTRSNTVKIILYFVTQEMSQGLHRINCTPKLYKHDLDKRNKGIISTEQCIARYSGVDHNLKDQTIYL